MGDLVGFWQIIFMGFYVKRFSFWLTGIFMLISVCSLMAAEPWDLGSPGAAEIGQSVTARYDQLKLHVPKSFEGRTAKEWRSTFSAEIKKLVRYTHYESDVELRGSATVFDFDYVTDIIDVQVYRSHNLKPGANSCMDCHGGEFARTSAIIGYENKELTPKPYRRGLATIYLDEASSKSFHGEINHWMTPHMMVKGRLQSGKLEQGRHSLDAKSMTIGLAGTVWHKVIWSGDLNFSKVDTYDMRKTFIGKVSYSPFKGFKIGVEGGAFLDGYTQYGTQMSEMGLMTVGLNKDNPNLLPTLFNSLKDDRFGYWRLHAEYQYKF